MTSLKDKPVRKGLREYLESIMIEFVELSFSSIKWIFRYSGLEFIYRKFKPAKNAEPSPTGIIWLIGIYVAFFGVASQRYENRVDKIENRANSIYTQLGTDVYKKALSRISTVQNTWCPEKPKILNPPSVIRSLFEETKYQELVELLKETVEDWKEKLDGVDLYEADLMGAELQEANLREANLTEANLQKASLYGADLTGADLQGAKLREANLPQANLLQAKLFQAKLQEANLWEANLQGADLQWADLAGANLQNANLRETNLNQANLQEADLQGADLSRADLRGAEGLTVEQLCNASILFGAKLGQKLEAQINQECPHLLK